MTCGADPGDLGGSWGSDLAETSGKTEPKISSQAAFRYPDSFHTMILCADLLPDTVTGQPVPTSHSCRGRAPGDTLVGEGLLCFGSACLSLSFGCPRLADGASDQFSLFGESCLSFSLVLGFSPRVARPVVVCLAVFLHGSPDLLRLA